MTPRRLPAVATALAAGLVLAACGDPGSPATDRPSVVVTYSVLGAVVADVVGDAATVTVLVPDGVDPHEWDPSPRDIEAVSRAAVVVANGVGLEESLADALEAEAAVLVEAGDLVTPRYVGDAEDPHLWMDPLAMRDVVLGLAPVLASAGIDVGDRADSVAADLERLVVEVDDTVAPLSPADRLLVTGHESLGWFADRFGFQAIGAVVPRLTSQAEPSAGDLADLTDVIDETGVSAIFTELGTPPSVVEAIADATGARVVEIATHDLPDDGRYRTFMLDIAARIVDGLSGKPDSSG